MSGAATRGEALGYGQPDWPEDLKTFELRVAYQRGVGDARRLSAELFRVATVPPIDMVLHCPKCGMQHVDAPDTNHDPHYEGHMIWDNPPHRSHLCAGCGHIWRPADVPTNGVALVQTKGTRDSPIEKDCLRAWPQTDRSHG